MPYKIIGNSEPKYLAAADILIGDMSDINYEFLYFNRPIILLANKWLRENFPDIGIKTDIENIENAIIRCINSPNDLEKQRKYWFSRTVHLPDGNSSKRTVNIIIEKSTITIPVFIFVHNNNSVIKNTLKPIYDEAHKRGFVSYFIEKAIKNDHKDNYIYVSANNSLIQLPYGFTVHVDHGLKGIGVTDFEEQRKQYRIASFHKDTDLHITEGKISFEKTKELVGPYSDRVVMVGYPRGDDYLRLNTNENKQQVCIELGFDSLKPLVIYAPAGKHSYPFKQGASLSNAVLKKLQEISQNGEFNILVKLKYKERSFFIKVLKKFRILNFEK
jgi:CDP-glycerol glycerophosphotransferase (TagB/SpsB family)